MTKKLLAAILSVIMIFAFTAGCNQDNDAGTTSGGDSGGVPAGGGDTPAPPPPGGGTVNLRVWSSQEDSEMIREMCAAFEALHPDTTFVFDFGIVSEADARSRYGEDPSAAADIFAFPNDQLRDFVNASALYQVTRNKAEIVARNSEGSIAAASLGDELWAYPMTADNGYFMYYDASVFTADDVKSLDRMLEVAQEAGKRVFMDVSNGWYIASFFLGNGGILALDDNGNQTCDFNNANGLAVAETIKAFTAHPAFITGDDSVLQGGMGTSIAAGVSGTWNAATMADILGDNYAAAKLPTMTVNGGQVQMASFGGYKLIGVNSLTSEPVWAMDLADWLTNEQNQIKRFERRQLGPSNINAANSSEVKANVALAALAEQNLYAHPQNDVLGGYWSPAEAFGATMEAQDYSKDLQTLLDEMVAQITMG